MSQNFVTTFLPHLDGCDQSYGLDVSDDLIVVGHCHVAGTFGRTSQSRAVRWVNGIPEDLGPGAAFAISANGRILIGTTGVGWSVWENGVSSLLPLSPNCRAIDINSHGDVLGDCSGSGIFVLRDGIAEQLSGPGWAYAINDQGQVLGWQAGDVFEGLVWKNGQRIAISPNTHHETYTGAFGWPMSLSRTKGLLGGIGDTCNPFVGCSGESDFRGYVWIAYPRDQVVP